MNTIIKEFFDRRTLNIFSFITGLLFIVSGIGKAIDTVGFTNLIYQYGLGIFAILSPVIILFEILLGFSLILLINPRRDSMISFVLLTIFTIVFAYAHFNYGVNNCGCFGAVQNTSLPPVFSFIRNFILMAMSAILCLLYPKEKTVTGNWKKYLIIAVMSIAIFVTGLTVKAPLYSIRFGLPSRSIEAGFQGQNIRNTELANYLRTTSDSTYLFFCFSYNCSHCWNSIENLRSFIRNKTVDSVVIFAVGDEKDRLIFEEKLKPDFPVTILNGTSMDKLTLIYPTAFYIEHDTVKVVLTGELPSPFIFSSYR